MEAWQSIQRALKEMPRVKWIFLPKLFKYSFFRTGSLFNWADSPYIVNIKHMLGTIVWTGYLYFVTQEWTGVLV